MELDKITRPRMIAGSVGVLAIVAGLSFWFFGGGAVQLAGDGSGGTCKPIETAAVTDDDFTVGEAKRLVAVREKAVKDHCLEGTPTFLLNGKKLDLNGPLLEALDGQLRSELKALGVKAPTNAAPTVP